MAESQDPQMTDNPVYVELAQRAKENKPPSRGNALGAVATTRAPGAQSRAEMMRAILDEDAALEVGHFGTVHYRPVTVAGVALKLEPVQPSIGTVVHGIDLARDLAAPEMVTFLRELWLARRVIMFRNQSHLSREQMADVARHFGEIGAPYGERVHMPNSDYDLSQQVLVGGERDMLRLISDADVPTAAANWHCDATWQPRPPMGSLLMCREGPPVGGDTCFCDAYGMWEGLPRKVKARIEHLRAVHVGAAGHQMDGVTPEAVHPVARTHPETGRTVLYVQQGFVRRFADDHGISADEQSELLRVLKLQEGRPEYTCRFRWEPGSIAMWDNRAVLHSASGDFWPHRRVMERLTILDYDVSRRTPYYQPE